MCRVSTPSQLEAQIKIHQQALQDQEAQQQSLYRVISKIRASLELDAIFRTTAKETCKLLRVDRIAVYRFDENWGGEFIHNFEFAEPGWDEVWEQKAVWDDTYLQENKGGRYARNEPCISDDVYQSGLSQCHLDILIQFQIRAYVTAPIFVGQKLWGILGAYQHLNVRRWTNQEVQFLSQVATQLGFAVTQAKLLEQTRQKAEEIQAANVQQKILLDLVSDIRESLDLDVLFKTMVKEVRRSLGADRVGIFQFDADSEYHSGRFVAENVLSEYDSAIAITVRDNCFGDRYAIDYQNGKMQVLDDVDQAGLSKCHLAILEQFQIKAQIIVPLKQQEKLWGLLCVHQCCEPRHWTASEARFVRQLAAHFTVALEQAHILAQVKDQAEQLTQTVQSLEVANAQLEKLNNVDALTQIANRRYFDNKLEREWRRLQRSQQSLSLIMFDVDHFKSFNDHFGHLVGDQCLQQIAQTAQTCIRRAADDLCRYGGEEFAVILPDTDQQGAVQIARDINRIIQQLAIATPENAPVPFVSVSLGIACLIPDLNHSPNQLIDQADKALYLAKKQGRNTWMVYQEEAENNN
jgi:diguanylate cyclase (GGDEF)-like protein